MTEQGLCRRAELEARAMEERAEAGDGECYMTARLLREMIAAIEDSRRKLDAARRARHFHEGDSTD